ncbi:YggS family pyridoxal phosphate-dependent enzyme [Ruminococcus difficilis]|uniref:Pyridoxal phosphate homeostasis protein n=1 Tax=Ruminococcus difficilis TaxID=2763069 RepID=A0A934U004_9FIRM|nr:YggS family pyridoxal phosphate-dependent enzyme [Ruminococcus difficilis]MBK6087970.1 YggS family pyridoxal phosphate-dependent enzyme [Ruminococcus difficilis]
MARSLADVTYNYQVICENIARAAQSVGKTADDITFLAATKTVDAPTINHAISLGLRYIGENRVQELLSKYEDYDLDHASLQFIGHLQTNKVRQIVGKVDLIQSVDSVKLAREISRCSIKQNISTDILLEVNIGREENKSGVLPEALPELLDEIKDIPAIKVRGLMAIPPICENAQENCKFFDNMRHIFLDIGSKNIDNISMEILSMGMSDDYAEAIRCGANMIRVGSALFGKRNYPT